MNKQLLKALSSIICGLAIGLMIGGMFTSAFSGEDKQKQAFEAGRIFERELLLNADSSKVKGCIIGYIPDSLYRMDLPELRDSGSYKIRSK